MVFSFSLWDLGLWSAVTAVVILVGSEVASPYYGKVNILLDLRKLRIAAFALGLVFFLIVSLRITTIIYSDI